VAAALADPNRGGFDRVITLTSPAETTRDAILFTLSRLRFDLRRQDTFVFYFSGHGTMEHTRDGLPLLYLAASDTYASDLWGTALELGALRAYFNALKPQRKVLILDNCFSGRGKSRINAVTRERLEAGPAPWPSLRERVAQSEAVLMASTLGGVAYEDPALGQGVFTHFLLLGMGVERARADSNGDGALTAYELHDYVRARTVAYTHGKQVPEGHFRVLGRAETYLSGTPMTAPEGGSALVYAYGNEAPIELAMEVDGQPRGSFPRTIPIEPGRREVTLRRKDGSVRAKGMVKVTPGQVYSFGMLLDALEGYRRYFGLELGPAAQLAGPAAEVWGRQAFRLGVISGHRVRDGMFRGLTLGLTAGFNPGYGGVVADLTDRQWRSAFDVGARAVLRRQLGRFQGGVGWQSQLVYTPAVTETRGAPAYAEAQYLHSWLNLQGGPMLWQAWHIDSHMLVTLEQRLSWFEADFQDSFGAQTNVQLTASVGLEVGF